MKTYLNHKNGKLHSFDIDNFHISAGVIANYLSKQPGISNVRRKKLENPDIRLEFEFRGVDYEVWEPFGDNSRYCVCPKNPDHPLLHTDDLEKLFQGLKVPLYRKILFYLLCGWVLWTVGRGLYLKLMS